jgi:hypothetical protein
MLPRWEEGKGMRFAPTNEKKTKKKKRFPVFSPPDTYEVLGDGDPNSQFHTEEVVRKRLVSEFHSCL